MKEETQMSNKYMYKKTNTYKVQNNDFRYQPSIFGKIALCIAVPAAIIGIISVFLAFVVSSRAGDFFVVCLVAEVVAFIGGIVIIIDIIISNKKNRKILEKTGKVKKKEKDIANLLHFIVGLAIGILLGFLIWGFQH